MKKLFAILLTMAMVLSMAACGGAAKKDGRLVTCGGRVLGVCATGDTLRAALDTAYGRVEKISFEKAFYRHDIGKRALLAGKE